MLSKAQNKYIRSLTQQKFRREFNAFIAEGDKIASEWLNSTAKINIIVAEEDWADANSALINNHKEAAIHIVKDTELQQLSALQTPNKALLVVEIPVQPLHLPKQEWCIALDSIQDPGNMGTIIRIADWFGIKHVVCSENCVDFYNPKVVQSAMGGHLRVSLYKTDLPEFIAQCTVPILAATLQGDNIHDIKKPEAAVLLMGNESKGISKELLNMVTQQITIPGSGGAESLNAAVSTGIICAMLMPS